MPRYDYVCEVCGVRGSALRQDGPPRFCSKRCRNLGMVGQHTKRRKYVITPEMHERIRRVYQSGTGRGQVRDLARRLGLPRWKIGRYAIRQGWIATQASQPDWSEEELAILEHHAHLCPEYIQKRLARSGYHRSSMAIVLKRKRMRFGSNLKGQSATSLAECFGVDMKVVQRWLLQGWLTAKRRGTKRTARQGGDMWFIKEPAVRRFIVNHVDVIDFRKVDKYWLVDVLTGGPGTVGMGAQRSQEDEPAPEAEEAAGENTDDFGVDPEVSEIFAEAQGMM